MMSASWGANEVETNFTRTRGTVKWGEEHKGLDDLITYVTRWPRSKSQRPRK